MRAARTLFPNALSERLQNLDRSVTKMKEHQLFNELLWDATAWEAVSLVSRLPFLIDDESDDGDPHLNHPNYVQVTKSTIVDRS